MPIVVLGSINHDLVTHTAKFPAPGETVHGVSFKDHLGGKGFNEAVACAKLKGPNDNFNIKLYGCLGDDSISDRFIDYLKKLDVKTDLINKVSNTTTGTASIIVDDGNNGENRIIVVPGANSKFNPSFDELFTIFGPSNNPEYQSSIDNPNLPSNLHSHSTKPLNNEEMAKTTDINPHPPSNLHAHGSVTSFNSIPQNNSSTGLVNKNGHLIHSWSASGLNLNQMATNTIPSSGSFLHSHKSEDIQVSRITGSIHDNSIPLGLHSHASTPKLNSATPSSRPSALDLHNAAITLASKAPIPNSTNSIAQNRLTNVSFSLGGTNAHSSSSISLSVNPSQSYSHLLPKKKDEFIDDFKYYVVLTNEIPNPYKIINHLSTNFPNVEIFYNPSPLPSKKIGYTAELLNSLHQSNYIIINETELLNIVLNYHPTPNREPLTHLKNVSNYEPSMEYIDTVNDNIAKLSKLRTILTKPTIIATLGPFGVLYSAQGSFSYSYIPSEDIDCDEIVDTTGAGDTFLGALITCIYRNESLESSVKFAIKASGESIKKEGAAESMPFYKDIEKRGWIL